MGRREWAGPQPSATLRVEIEKKRKTEIAISPTPHPLPETSLKGGGHSRVVSRFPCSGTLSHFILDLPPALSLQYYSSTLFIHYNGGLPLTPLPSIVLSYTFFVNSHSFILITCSDHLSVLRFTHSTTLQSTSIAVSLIPNLPYMSSLLSILP